MPNHLKLLHDHFLKHNINYGDNDISSILECLWSTYTESNPIHAKVIKDRFHDLGSIFDTLPRQQADSLFNVVCDLCLEHEKAAFIEGMQLGAKITAELG